MVKLMWLGLLQAALNTCIQCMGDIREAHFILFDGEVHQAFTHAAKFFIDRGVAAPVHPDDVPVPAPEASGGSSSDKSPRVNWYSPDTRPSDSSSNVSRSSADAPAPDQSPYVNQSSADAPPADKSPFMPESSPGPQPYVKLPGSTPSWSTGGPYLSTRQDSGPTGWEQLIPGSGFGSVLQPGGGSSGLGVASGSPKPHVELPGSPKLSVDEKVPSDWHMVETPSPTAIAPQGLPDIPGEVGVGSAGVAADGMAATEAAMEIVKKALGELVGRGVPTQRVPEGSLQEATVVEPKDEAVSMEGMSEGQADEAPDMIAEDKTADLMGGLDANAATAMMSPRGEDETKPSGVALCPCPSASIISLLSRPC
jgi:hypothetical protein